MSSGSWLRLLSDEWPVPKSSIASCTDIHLSFCSVAEAPSKFSTTALSVSSRIREPGSNPVSRKADSTSSMRLASWSWRAETLTLIDSPAACGRSDRQRASCRHTSCNTQRPIGRMSPVSSATGMNSPGGTRVPSGRRQRTSASTPTIWLPSNHLMGW